jgi:hypothetical protein
MIALRPPPVILWADSANNLSETSSDSRNSAVGEHPGHVHSPEQVRAHFAIASVGIRKYRPAAALRNCLTKTSIQLRHGTHWLRSKP